MVTPLKPKEPVAWTGDPSAPLSETAAPLFPSPLQRICEEWAADLIKSAPPPHQRASFEVMIEALPDLIKRLDAA